MTCLSHSPLPGPLDPQRLLIHAHNSNGSLCLRDSCHGPAPCMGLLPLPHPYQRPRKLAFFPDRPISQRKRPRLRQLPEGPLGFQPGRHTPNLLGGAVGWQWGQEGAGAPNPTDEGLVSTAGKGGSPRPRISGDGNEGESLH